MVSWNTDDRGQRRDSGFTTSYGDDTTEADFDGKSCADFACLPGRGIEDAEWLR